MSGPVRKRRMKPRSVCPKCEGLMQRKMAISERVASRHWGDADPFLALGEVDIHQFICVACGNISCYQVKGEDSRR